MTTAELAQGLNWGVAFWHLLSAAVIAAAMRSTIDLVVGRLPAARKTGAAVTLGGFTIGVVGLLFGAGAHYAALAYAGPLHAGEDHELFFTIVQCFGGPLVLVGAWVIVHRFLNIELELQGE